MEIPSGNAPSRANLQALWITWAGMLGSLFIYVAVCVLFEGDIRNTVSINVPLDLVGKILLAVSILTLIVTHFVRRRMLGTGSASPGPASLNAASSPGSRTLIDRYRATMFVSLALAETIGIYGIVLFVLGDRLQTLYAFTGISAVAMLLYRPKKEDLDAMAVAAQMQGTADP